MLSLIEATELYQFSSQHEIKQANHLPKVRIYEYTRVIIKKGPGSNTKL